MRLLAAVLSLLAVPNLVEAQDKGATGEPDIRFECVTQLLAIGGEFIADPVKRQFVYVQQDKTLLVSVRGEKRSLDVSLSEKALNARGASEKEVVTIHIDRSDLDFHQQVIVDGKVFMRASGVCTIVPDTRLKPKLF